MIPIVGLSISTAPRKSPFTTVLLLIILLTTFVSEMLLKSCNSIMISSFSLDSYYLQKAAGINSYYSPPKSLLATKKNDILYSINSLQILLLTVYFSVQLAKLANVEYYKIFVKIVEISRVEFVKVIIKFRFCIVVSRNSSVKVRYP